MQHCLCFHRISANNRQGYFGSCKTLLTNADLLPWFCSRICVKSALFKKIVSLVNLCLTTDTASNHLANFVTSTNAAADIWGPLRHFRYSCCRAQQLGTMCCISDWGHWHCIPPFSIVTWESECTWKAISSSEESASQEHGPLTTR